jgi:hypothetical protein
MFYCEACRADRGWPETINVKSEGACELCGRATVCHDVPGHLIDDPAAYAEFLERAKANPRAWAVLQAARHDDPNLEQLIEEWWRDATGEPA